MDVSSGSNHKSFAAQAGANAFAVDMGTGQQSFSLTRGGKTILSGTSLKDISANCICGIYNFNAYVGTLPAAPPDSLQSPDGFANFASGLAPGLCAPTPSLGTAPLAQTGTPPLISSSPLNPQSIPSSTTAPLVTASASVPSIATPIPPTATASTSSSTHLPTSTALAPSTTTTTQPDGSATVTALSQLSPTNCLQAAQIWAGPVGSDPPARCDGS